MVQFPSAPFPPRCFHVKLSHRIVHVGHSKLYRPITSRYSGDYVHSFRKLSCLLITPIPAPKRWIQKKRRIQQQTTWTKCSALPGTGEFWVVRWHYPTESWKYRAERQKGSYSWGMHMGGGNPPYRGDNSRGDNSYERTSSLRMTA